MSDEHEERRQICLNITEVQLHTIQSLFNHSEWDFDSSVIFNNWSNEQIDQTAAVDEEIRVLYTDIPESVDQSQELDGERCITTCTEFCNTEKKYKKFWTMMSRRNAWNHPIYLQKKANMLNWNAIDSERIVWTLREVMPDCVFNVVRELYPNPPGQLYMGHKWI
ncbi:hypothetical protein FSP39_007411 [Pinctada imbricata]|uniref:Uncharacterized protein n=1 Tax=Pinctada imbricata TaxID=66713 RepID=A0AA88YTK8_PINIB|nr:hypothetical protein FSP39_007411 [Pinctada imbricata]